MSNSEAVIKKSFKVKVREFFRMFAARFYHSSNILPQADEADILKLQELLNMQNKSVEDSSFESLKDAYVNYKVGIDNDGSIIGVEKSTGIVTSDPKFIAKIRFATLWRKSAFGDLDSTWEESCMTESFSKDSEAIYLEIKDIISEQLKLTGNINTAEFLNKMKDSKYKWGRVCSRRLFRNIPSTDTVDCYFRSVTPNVKSKTKPTLSLSQALYGLEEN